MGDFLRTSVKAGIIIFGTHYLLQRMKASESEEIMQMLQKMANGNGGGMMPGNTPNPGMGIGGMSSGEMEKEMEMLMMQDGGMSAYSITENNPDVLPPSANYPLTVGASAEHLSPLADSIQRIYPSNQKPTNYERINFAGRKTNVYPYTSNKLRRLKQHRARFHAQYADQYASMGPIRGADPFDSGYMPFQ